MGRRTADRAIVLIPLLLLAAAVGFGGAKEIRLELQVEPELELDGTEKIYVGPVLLEPRTQAASSVDLFAVREFERFVRSILRRQTRLNLVPPVDDLSVPSDDPDELAGTAGFWRLLGEETGADYIMSASIELASTSAGMKSGTVRPLKTWACWKHAVAPNSATAWRLKCSMKGGAAR